MKNIFKKVSACFFAAIIMVTTLGACSDDTSNSELQGSILDFNILIVQTGSPILIPDITYVDAYNYFFDDPQWRGFEATDGSDVVEFSGGCTYFGEAATAYIQFVFDDEETFSLNYASLEVDGEKIVADEQVILELIYTPFATYSEEVLGEPLDQDVYDAFFYG